MAEYSDAIGDVVGGAQQAAQAQTVASVDDDPEKATRAIELSQAWGVPPTVVYSDMDSFERRQKSTMASQIVGANSQLTEYANSHPLAPKVSNDDWGQLDTTSQSFSKFMGNSVLGQMASAFKTGFDLSAQQEEYNKLYNFIDSPVWRNFVQSSGALAPFSPVSTALAAQAGFHAITGALYATGAGIREVYKGLGGSEAWADRLTRDIVAGAQVALPELAESHGIPQMTEAIRGPLITIKPYLDEGKVPPVGTHPLTDQAHVEQAKLDADNLSEALKESIASATRERSPELFQKFAEQHFGERTIGIAADAVRKVYGDAVPTPGDRILGFVPGIRDQLDLAEATGGDVKVPLADYLAKVEPEVHKQLEDHIRARPEGMTVEEGKTLPEPTEAIGPVDQLRESAKLNPVPRAELKLEDSSVNKAGETTHHFTLNTEGKPRADLYLTEEDGGKTLYVDDFSAPGDIEKAANTLGPRAVRDAVEQIKEQFPNAEKITGLRVSGAREAAGVETSAAESSIDLTKIKPRKKPEQLELPVEGTTRMEDRPPFEGAAPGITKAMTKKYVDLIKKRTEEDQQYYLAKEMEAARKKQSAARKERSVELRPQASLIVSTRPDVALDEQLATGKLKLNPETLTPEQKALLPKEFYAENGVDPHSFAEALDASSPAEVVSRIAAITNSRLASNMRMVEFHRRLVSIELEKMLDASFKDSEASVLQDAMDHVVSKTQEELLHEQTLGLALEAGEEYPINPDMIKSGLREKMKQTPASEIDSAAYMATAGRAGRALEEASLKGDIAEQFRQSQRQQNAFLQARIAKEFEKQTAELERIAKKYSKREVKGVETDYVNAIHAILEKAGMKIGRRPEDLEKELGAGYYENLPNFIDAKAKEYEAAGIELPVPDFLLGDKVPPYSQMTMEQAQGLHDALKSLDHLGLSERKVIVEGNKADLKDWVKQAVEQLKEKFGTPSVSVRPEGVVKRFAKQFAANAHSLETVWKRFDSRDPEGMFTKMFVYPAAKALNDREALMREFAKDLREIGKLENPKQAINHDFIDPNTGEKFQGFDRGTLEAIVANIGNKYNRDRMAYTLGLIDEEGKPDTARLMQWVEANTKPEDLARAQARGEIFNKGKRKSDTVYRGIYGVAPEDITISPFAMHGQVYEGWYHPIIPDPVRAVRDHAAVPDDLTRPTSFWPSTPNSYTKRRTGAYERLLLNNDMVPVAIGQMVHDIAVRDFVYNTAKIINDNEFRQGMIASYGKEYYDVAKKWLMNIAGGASYNASAISAGPRFSNMLRQNVISTYIAFNLGTVFKHAPTAAVMSMRQVGLGPYLKASGLVYGDSLRYAAMSIFGRDPALGESIWQFVRRVSEEIQRRDRNWMESMGGAQDIITGQPTLRNRITQWGASAVAFSDMISAVPLWYAKYTEEMGVHADHARAVERADLAVRDAHGSTSVASKPVIASNEGALAPWFTSLYGFFGANMQRKIEMLHDMNDAYQLGKGGDLKAAAKMIPGITASMMAYVIFPAIVEEQVTGQFTEDHQGLGQKALGIVLQGLTNSIIGVREMSWAFGHGQEPSAGLISGPLHDLANLKRDVFKNRPFSKEHIGSLIQNTLTAYGDLRGTMPKPIARAIRYGVDVSTGQQRPRGFGDWYRGLISGQQQLRKR